MSYARFGVDGSDVYIFLHEKGFECSMCIFNATPDSRIYKKTFDLLRHLEEHQRRGHIVPERTFERLLKDQQENDLFLLSEVADLIDNRLG